MNDIKQFKLTNDDEIICEVLTYSTEDDASMVIRGALRIVFVEDFQKGVRFYAFRPWLGFNDDPTTLQTLNAMHIICEANPTDKMLDYYVETLDKIKVNLDSERHDMPLDEIASQAEEMDEDEFQDFLADYIDNKKKAMEKDSDAPGNVITFKPKKDVFH